MPNHFHILVRFEKQNASEAIKNLCERYAKYFNIKYQRKDMYFMELSEQVYVWTKHIY